MIFCQGWNTIGGISLNFLTSHDFNIQNWWFIGFRNHKKNQFNPFLWWMTNTSWVPFFQHSSGVQHIFPLLMFPSYILWLLLKPMQKTRHPNIYPNI
jgi:hypothetical protein